MDLLKAASGDMPKYPEQQIRSLLGLLLAMSLLLSGCQPQGAYAYPQETGPDSSASSEETPAGIQADPEGTPTSVATPFPTRPLYQPGELVDYIAQTGDSLPALAVRFNTTVSEILQANPFIPTSATTMPPGMPMRIPIYYLPFWGTPYQIIPDSLFINGPAQVDFNTQEFVAQHTGWLSTYIGYVSGENRSGAQIIDVVAKNFSVSPRLLLALLEYQSGALTQPNLSLGVEAYPLGYIDRKHQGLYMQLVWAANLLNNGYYAWRMGTLTSLDPLDGRIERPDPWQNAATVSLQNYFAQMLPQEDYAKAISQDGIASVYRSLFGDPWDPAASPAPHIPGSLVQPEFSLPFEIRRIWAFTGGPHTGWGEGQPYAALDFAPPTLAGGCLDTGEWATAVAPGIVVRSEPAIVVLDLDGDDEERTGWTILYLHVGARDQVAKGAVLNTGDPIGHPSCEGGRATGTHIHIARKYNGEWIPADGTLAFNLEGWIAHNGSQPYLGTLTRFSRTITACVCSDYKSHIESEWKP